jgi:hypothetical protein
VSIFAPHKWTGGDGVEYELTPFVAQVGDTGDIVKCGKLSRRGHGNSDAVMRLQVDDLGVLAMHAREAFMEALGRVSLEITALDLQERDAIEGLGEVEKVERSGTLPDGSQSVVIATITQSGTQVVFTSDDKGMFKQLIDITRDKADL